MGWVVTPPTPVPVEPYTGWDDTPEIIPTHPVRGWQTFAGAVAADGDLSADGALTAAFIKRGLQSGNFYSTGQLQPSIFVRQSQATSSWGEGFLSAPAAARHYLAADFNGIGEISTELSIIIGQDILPMFNGMGHLGTVVIPYPPDHDGLQGDVYGRITTAMSLAGAGALSASVFEIEGNAAYFTGSGALTAKVAATGNSIASFVGVGALAATAYQYKTSLAGFSGIGTFSGSVVPKPAIPAALSGNGSLTATDYPVLPQAAPLTGNGSLAAGLSQRITLDELAWDYFNRANASTLGAQWLVRSGTPGITNNAMYAATTGQWATASFGNMGTNSHEVQIVMGPMVGTNDYTVGFIGMNEAGEGIIGHAANGSIYIYSVSGSGGWQLNNLVTRASGTATWTTGDKFAIRRLGNVVYTSINGVDTGINWDDSTVIIPKNQTHRIVGAGSYNDASTGYRTIDAFGARDYQVPQMPFFSGGSLSATVAFPVKAEVTTQYQSQGNYNYPIPYWCNKIDEVLLGAGGGGGGGDSAFGKAGNGGQAGQYAVARTLVRGVDFGYNVAAIPGVVGTGGAAGALGSGAPAGTATTRAAIGSAGAVSAPGGAGGFNYDGNPGASPGNTSYNGKTYTGGGTAVSGSGHEDGKVPGGGGGGGAGGFLGGGSSGNKGAPGSAWYRAYQ
jgi:hypothetical protein